jgi:hypothetical protein
MGGSSSGSSDQASLRTVTGSVARVDQNSITLDQSAGGVTLTVDSQTQVLRRGQPVAQGISAIREGTQVRASFDPASNRADKIEVMGRASSKSNKSKGTSGGSTMNTGSSPGSTTGTSGSSGSVSGTSRNSTGAGTDQTNSKSNTGSGDTTTNNPK